MKPFKILLFFLSVYIILFAVALYFPEKGIKMGNLFTLNFITANDIFGKNAQEYADISKIIHQNEGLNDSVIAELAGNSMEPWDTVRANADSLRKKIFRIEFPHQDKSILFPVFRAMMNLQKSGELIRIMHYGDSQIEGDRITSFIRNRLQNRFGGYGVGLVPVQQVYDFSFSILQENSDNWYRYTAFGNRDTTILHGRYGALASYCMFSPKDIFSPPDKDYEAWVSFNESKYSYANTKQFSQCRIYYSNNKEPFINEIYQNDQLVDAEMFPVSKKLKVISWKFDEPQSSLMLKFKGKSSPEIYGITLDPLKGIAVDNVAMRGSSGLIFTKMDQELLAEMYKKLNVKLLILQFGGNVVPYLTDNYDYYENLFYKQLKTLKKILPDISIIVIGVADMSTKVGNRYITYPNLEQIRNALKNASFKAGTAYWDMYEAMGGKNSMPSWVFAEPPLAGKDFVHFNPKGARIIAQMFYNAFIYEYNLYENQKKKPAVELKAE